MRIEDFDLIGSRTLDHDLHIPRTFRTIDHSTSSSGKLSRSERRRLDKNMKKMKGDNKEGIWITIPNKERQEYAMKEEAYDHTIEKKREFLAMIKKDGELVIKWIEDCLEEEWMILEKQEGGIEKIRREIVRLFEAIPKGSKYGACNRTGCVRNHALVKNNGNGKYYCLECALRLNDQNPEYKKEYGKELCEYDGVSKELIGKELNATWKEVNNEIWSLGFALDRMSQLHKLFKKITNVRLEKRFIPTERHLFNDERLYPDMFDLI
jgi:hypothetical protein